MSNYQCHYECLKVTRDAPAEVIRAAYRSLSQKHHPDKNVGNPDAARVMSRLNYAYSVLSDAAQRELYDLQSLHGQRGGDYAFHEPADVSGAAAGPAWLQRVGMYAAGRKGRFLALVAGIVVISAAVIFRSVWKDQQSMLLLEQAALPAAGSPSIARTAVPAQVDAISKPPAAAPAPTEPVAPAAATSVPAVVTKTGEFERLAALLKSMGLGLHKLDAPAPAPAPVPTAGRPAPPAQPAEPDKAAVTANAPATPPSRLQASAAVVAPEAGRPREEVERPAAPEPARAEAGRTNTPQPALASAGAALRQAVIADARACAPIYPARAYSNGESGTVQLALLVGGDGGVIESKVQKSSGHPELDKAARKALSQCRFKVAGNDRSAEPVWTNVEYAFSLD